MEAFFVAWGDAIGHLFDCEVAWPFDVWVGTHDEKFFDDVKVGGVEE